MKRADRLAAIIELLAASDGVEVDELVESLGISAATARRDLDALAEQRLLTRTRGGAMPLSVAYELPLRYKNHQRTAEKQRIARMAAHMIPAGSVVGLTGGTTTTAIAAALAMRSDAAAASPYAFTVVTNSVNIAAQLATRPDLKIVVTGGVLNSRSYELVGGYAEQVLRGLTIDVAFIGVNGIDAETGATTHDEREAATNRLMAARARQSVVVADSSKIGRTAFAVMGGPERFPIILTDAGITPAQRAALVERGYDVRIAE
ncbi:DeoR/GlpR family DNA-binding transcription regulator [Microbacterium sp. ASV49]|uniref:DeoR/GlpR family DNA-binding transcription regulator n=1 Tax=Microbacterium candidum TaxID=3041922 RepID=A0ABT7MX08_9MICO|nr:DeoR/GlpR family DNA-binding transcription regulator [Microbacterium sp. ASV49]MDL9978973.1 DeoR/GlpR family DNA-binding transcription regulator [Microbacterium sp. ASV49]